MGILKKLYNLIIINTLDRIDNINSVVDGVVVSIFGMLLGLAGYYGFGFIGFAYSAQISFLGVVAYLAVGLYHMVEYEREKVRTKRMFSRYIESSLEIMIILLILLFLYVMVFDQIIAVWLAGKLAQEQYGLSMRVLRGLPGLAVLAFPLFAWEKFAEWTPTDEILRKVFKGGN